MTLAIKDRSFQTLTLSEANPEQYVDLDPGLATEKIVGVISGSITVTGANGDGVLNDDTLQRLITNIRLERDGLPLVRDIPLRDMYQIFLRSTEQVPAQDVPTTAEIQAAGTYDFRLYFEIPFASPWLAAPWNTHLPPMRVDTALRLTVTWNTTRVNSGDSAGAGAIVKSGSDAYTWGTTPSVKLYQIGSTKINSRGAPKYVRAFSQIRTDSFTTAQDRLSKLLTSQRAFDFHLLRFTDDGDLSNLVNSISFEDTRDQYLREMGIDALWGQEAQSFPAVNRETGYLGIRFAAGGLLSNAVLPKEHTDLRYVFDVGTPSGTGIIVITMAELLLANSG